jgi:UDP-3-O-[3-hydroxymyristoyl] glucosamine N-acyltransferase
MFFKDLHAFDAELEVVHSQRGGESLVIKRIVLAHDLAPSTLAFVKNNSFLTKLNTQLAKGTQGEAVVIFDQKLWLKLEDSARAALTTSLGAVLVSKNVPLSMARLSKPLYDEHFKGIQSSVDGRQMGTTDIHPTVLVSQGAFIGENVKIGAGTIVHPGVVIAPHVVIGENVTLFANVAVYSFTTIDKNVRIHANTVIGSDGFGYVFDKGIHHKIWHTGGVQIHADVEIGANSSVDMGAFTPTIIGAGTRIDNQVQIGHNVKIGKGCILCGQSGVAGSAVLEDYVVLGGRAAVGPDAHLGQGVQVAGAGMVNESAEWPAGSVLGGHPARDIKEWMRTFAWLRKNALKN